MQSVEELWRVLEAAGDRGGARRIGDEPGHDFYASINPEGYPGLLLLTDDEPPTPPEFDLVRIAVARRHDGRWLTTMWLEDTSLASVFAEVCQTLVLASEPVPANQVAAFSFTRLLKWRRLLEAGSSDILSIVALRGLIGELLVLKRCLEQWTAEEVISGWLGPFHAPQDFALPNLLIESKAVMKTAAIVQISSIDQLDVPDDTPLLLGVVTLSASTPQGANLISIVSLIDEIRRFLAPAPQSLEGFDRKLGAAGYADSDKYGKLLFRIEGIKYYKVADDFPRLRRGKMSAHITKASYDISIGALEPFKVELAR